MKTVIDILLVPFRFVAATFIFLSLSGIGLLLALLLSIEKKTFKPFKNYFKVVAEEFISWLKYPIHPFYGN